MKTMKAALLTAVLAGLLQSIGAVCSSKPNLGASMIWNNIVTEMMGAVTCNSNNLFNTGDVAIAIYCVSGKWQTITATCSATASTACTTDAPAVWNATLTTGVANLFVYYTCNSGLSFLSGMPARMSQCLSGTWLPLLDVCDAACATVRDCNEVEQLGFNISGSYMIVPSGIAADQQITVFCELSDTDLNGGHWTRIFYNNQTSMTETSDQYSIGFSYPNNAKFIGLSNLHILTRLVNSSDIRPQVLEVFVTVGGVNYVASYSNFTLDSATNAFAIASLGDYHGNAGDALCPHLHLPFAKDSSNIGWWGLPSMRDDLISSENGSLLTAAKMMWRPLTSLDDVTVARMRIRPVSYDRTVTCPPTAGLEPSWTSTKGNWTYVRTPGVIQNYTCVGFSKKEPLSLNTSGAIKCLPGVNGGQPTWNTTVDFPCRLVCPDGYANSGDEKRCNYFSNDTAAGVHLAAAKCMDLYGGSLGLLVSEDDFYASGTDQEYYTGHTSRGSHIMFPPGPNETVFPCLPTSPATTCTPVHSNQCVTVMSSGNFTSTQCYLTKRYMCTLPSYCPEGYTNINGGCYMVVAATNISDAVKACNANGSDLAYPVTSTHFDYLLQSLSSNSLWTGQTTTFLIGNNKANGTWDSNGRYPTADTDETLKTSLYDADDALPYRAIINSSTGVTSIGLDWTSPVTHAVCQWQTAIGCFTELPLPTANMTTQNITTYNFGDTNDYTCDPGFWVGGNTSLETQTLDCRGALGDWQPPLLPCVRVPVCVNSTPTYLLPGVTNITAVDSFFLNGSLTYTCQPGMGVLSNDVVNQTLTCLQDSNTQLFGYVPAYVNCTICLGEPTLANASTNYDPTLNYTYTESSSLTATCNATYHLSLGVTAQPIYCTSTGWNMTGLMPCRPACTSDPPAPGLNMTRDTLTDNWVGTVLKYNCSAGYNMESDGVLPIEATTTATCIANGTWVSPRSVFDCYLLTLSNPPAAATGVTSTWVGNGTDNRRPDAVVTYTCPAGKLLANLSSTMQTVSVNGNWTPVLTTSMLNCTTACLTAPPSALGNASASSTTAPRLMNDVINYTCPASTSTVLGQTFSTVVCNSTGQWSPVQTNSSMTDLNNTLICFASCPGPPFPAPYMASYNYTNFLEGAVVNYTCPGSFLDGNVSVITACRNQTWTVSYIPPCIITTTAGPTTAAPVVLPTNSPYDLTYSHTTSMMWPSIQINMTDTDGINTTYRASEGPFGFGYAVVLDSSQQQCLKQTFNSTNATTQCSMSKPQLCPKGLSFSIWEKHYFTEDMFMRYSNVTDSDIKYVLSTGGDTNGHPGIALYHYGIYQTAVVSTGAQYWKVQVPGLMYNATWNNLGIRFDPKVSYDANGNPNGGGLSLFINLKLSGQSFLATNVTPALPGLSPPEVILGCHKDSGNPTYRNFGDGEYDELAMWSEALPPNKTLYFLGGYESNFSNISPEKMAVLMANVNLKDPAQLAAAAAITAKLTMNDATPTTAPAIDSSASSPTATAVVASPTPMVANTNLTLSASDAKNMAKMDNLVEILLQITKTENLPQSYDLAGFEPFSTVLNIASNLLDKNHATTWRQIQSNGSAGAAKVLNALQSYMIAAFCRINFTSDSSPINYVKATNNIVFSGQIVLLGTLTAQGPHIQLPDYKHPTMADVKGQWDNMYDSIRVPTGSMNDDRCNSRTMCLCTIIYNSYDQIGPSPFSTKSIPEGTVQNMGSRVVSFQIMAMPVYNLDGTIDGSAPLCLTDQATLNKVPFYFVFENSRKLVALRQLQFHDDEETSNVVTRRCVYWNESIGDYGAFDSTGCKIVNASEILTACACSKFGIVGVLEQIVQPREVPYEQSWLALVKYVLYGISAFLLILYCIVVAISSDLKEQFHLMGANLSVCVIIGSVIMCVSDIQSIRDDRHMCTAVGTLVQFFYLSVGGWVACLGHASFKAITSGVVGGKLASYSCVTWGMSFVSIGIPFTLFIKDVGTDPRCFISYENIVKAAFFVPQLAYVCVAFFLGEVILCNLATTALRKENLIEDYGSFCRGAAFVMLYFGFTWVLGLLAYMRFGISANFFPIFQIMNSMTGIIIFIFIGLASNRYRRAIAGKAQARREKMKGLAGGACKKPLAGAPVQSVPKPENVSSPPPAAGASLRPPSRGQVAGRPGSRPVSPF